MNLHLHPRTVGSSPTIATPVAATHPLPVLDPGFCAAVEAHLVRSTAQWRRAGVAALGLTAAGATIALTVALRRRPSQSLGGAFGGGLVACFAGCVLAVVTVASLQQLQRIRAAARSPRRAAWTEHALVLHRGRTKRSTAEYVLLGAGVFRVAGHVSTGSLLTARGELRRIRVTDLSADTVAAALPDASVLLVLRRADAATTDRILRRHQGRPAAA